MTRRLLLLAATLVVASGAHAQRVDPRLYAELRWRNIGPFRASRTKAAVGVPGQPGVFYVGAVNGGVWKTNDFGRTWNPIFDDQPTGSIGAISVAPSDPNVVYVGSGEGLQRPDLSTGDGIYRSADAGRTWTHLGLRDGQQIPQIVVDPKDPDRLFVAVLGHPYGPNAERGIYRSTDGGRSFERVLYRDENTGAIDVAFDPSDPRIVYAALWEARQGPWENGQFSGPGSGLFKSSDGGATWRPIGRGLPDFEHDGLGRIGITVAPSLPSRLFATVDARSNGGLYRSDDGGETFHEATKDERVVTRASDFAEVKVDPRNPDVVYTASVVTWKSTDGGKTFAALRGAPGGDDYHRLWIDPGDPRIILLAGDQGAIVTVNGGETWSSWYNQPTAAFYHVIADNAFPYRVCGGQQESGSACVDSRSDDGRITFASFHPVGVEEYGYVAPDPLDPDIVYGGKVSRYDRRTHQVQNVAPVLRGVGPDSGYRVLRTAPVLFSPLNPRKLYFASNVVWQTLDGGRHWTRISPDLTRRDSVVPPSVGRFAGTSAATVRHPGVVYALAPSYVDERTLWAGSDDGLIHVTTDGGDHWTDVTPPAIRARPWSKISIIDAGRFDARTAYVAVNAFRLDDLRPHVWRTHDGGRTWTEIVAGIDSGAAINTVREDPKRKGLLYAGSETQVWVSFDDGDHWQSLRLNMPATSIRDLVVKDDDILVGTHGRSFWILDDVAPLRQVTAAMASEPAVLLQPAPAIRWRSSTWPDTPLPPDEPAGENPPEGAMIDYWIGTAGTRDPGFGVRDSAVHRVPSPESRVPAAPAPVTLEILDAAGRLVTKFASTDTAMAPRDVGNWPAYWIRPTRVLSAEPGMHRFVWDLHHPYPAVLSFEYPISAVPHDTPREPRGPLVPPGRYTVRLTAGGKAYSRSLTVRMDPRVRTTLAGLREQYVLSMRLHDDISRDREALDRIRAARAARAAQRPGQKPEDKGGPATVAPDSLDLRLVALNGQLAQLMQSVQEADLPPTPVMVRAADELHRELERRLAASRPARGGAPR